MSDNLPVLRGGFLATRAERKAEKAMEAIKARALVATLHDHAEIARVRQTGKLGMTAVCEVSAEEARLAPTDPLHRTRVQIVANAAAEGIARIVRDAGSGF